MDFNKFKIDAKVKTTVYMSVDDVGVEIKVGTIGTIFSEPSDDEELVGVVIHGALNYLPQDVLEMK